LLGLAGVDWAAVHRWATAPHPGYRLAGWVGHAPEDLVASYGNAEDAMADAPTGDLDWVRQTWDVRRVREYEEWARQRGWDYWVVTAVHEQTATVAGLTSVFVSRWTPRRANQDDTVVVPAHRGHGLGLWVKAELLRRLREQRPEVAEIVTFNATSNVHMRQINKRLGFRPDRSWTEWQGAQWAANRAAVADVNAKLAAWSPALQSADVGGTVVNVTSGPVPVTCLAKRVTGVTWLFCQGDGSDANPLGANATASVTVPPGTVGGTAEVLDENRSIPLDAQGRITDAFTPYQLHVYKITPGPAGGTGSWTLQQGTHTVPVPDNVACPFRQPFRRLSRLDSSSASRRLRLPHRVGRRPATPGNPPVRRPCRSAGQPTPRRRPLPRRYR
jgi:RimJ/RimL family protein N-acetyltransferase